MNLLAAGGGDYLFLVVMLVFGLINWLANKAKEGKQAPPKPSARRAPPQARAPSSRDPEEERMRRFLEALGVPAGTAEPPSPPPYAPPRPRPHTPPIPRLAPVARRAAPPPLPVAERSLDEDDTTTEPVERIHLRELRTAEVPEFQTVSSRVSADPDADFVTVSAGISAVPSVAPIGELRTAPRESEARSRALFAILHSTSDLRTALVLREILGPPRSLQR